MEMIHASVRCKSPQIHKRHAVSYIYSWEFSDNNIVFSWGGMGEMGGGGNDDAVLTSYNSLYI